jgi:hypothetical protein
MSDRASRLQRRNSNVKSDARITRKAVITSSREDTSRPKRLKHNQDVAEVNECTQKGECDSVSGSMKRRKKKEDIIFAAGVLTGMARGPRGVVPSDRTASGNMVTVETIEHCIREYSTSTRARERKDHSSEDFCLDKKYNQARGCRCVHVLVELASNSRLEFMSICSQIHSWYLRSRETQRAYDSKTMSENVFEQCFHRCMTIKRNPNGGSSTRMIDLAILPVPDITMDTNVHVRQYLPENYTVTTSTLCINSALGVWRAIVQMDESQDMETWQKRDYRRILYQGARNMQDTSTQLEMQKMFYARVQDFLQAGKDNRNISFKLTAESLYRDNNEDDEAGVEDRLRRLRLSLSQKWKHWNFNTIHMLLANSDLLYNKNTKLFVERVGIKIDRVSDEVTNTLCKLAKAFWKKEKDWDRVSHDKELLFRSFRMATSISHAINAFWGNRRKQNEQECSRCIEIEELHEATPIGGQGDKEKTP